MLEHDFKLNMLSFNKKVIIFMMLISFFLFKPTVIGIDFTPIGMMLSIFCCILYISGVNRKVKLSKRNACILVAVTIYYLYVCIQSLVLLGFFSPTFINAFLSIACLISCFAIIFNDKEIEFWFFKVLIGVFCLFAMSNVFTIVFSRIFSLEQILLLDKAMMEMDGGYRLQIYFPLTSVYGRLMILDQLIMRLTSLFREPGIAQAFYIWALVVSKNYYRSNLPKYLLLLGVIMTFSTAGFINIIAVLALYVLFNLKLKHLKTLLITVSLLAVIGGVFTSIKGLNLETKSSHSYDARVGKLDEGFHEYLDSPLFGTGASDIYIEGTATSLLQQSYALGTVGILLYFSIFLTGLLNEKYDKKTYFLSYISILFTVCFSQPIENAPLTFLPLLACMNIRQNI